ncbi:MAG: signal peptide peptidase SppA [Planctomycetes bacterium]|nr:signal peptide peptidase SppA [Planctomycetota bacterium]
MARPSGIWQAIIFMMGVFLFGAVFFIGIFFGVASAMFSTTTEDSIYHKTFRAGSRQTIAIIPVMGLIDAASAEFVRMAVDNVLNNDHIRAVVLRVDSPGGGVTASDEIWYEITRLQDAGLPVVASYGSMAASGGYYISCATDFIMAEETCTTGSIGVIAQIYTMEDLMHTIGVEPVTLVATGSPEKNVANDIFRKWNDKDREKILVMLDEAYSIFNRRVRDGRASVISDPARINELADGSIYTARQALDHGLIDGLGYLDDAIAQAESLSSITSGTANVVILKQPPTFFTNGLFTSMSKSTPTLDADAIRRLINDLGSPRVMFLMH